MSVSPAILNKVKLLLNLTQSPNQNEADTARAMADKLIAKHNITEEDLKSIEEKVFYGENEKLFSTVGIVGWRQQLALCIANYFECQIVQEELQSTVGQSHYTYFVYGDDDQVKDVQFVFHAFTKKVEDLVATKCIGRGEIYVASYCEGVAESIRGNIDLHGIDIPEIKRPVRKVEEKPKEVSQSITHTKTEKESPTDNRVNISGQSMIKDVMAYFKGISDGRDLSLQDILELDSESEEIKQIPEPQ